MTECPKAMVGRVIGKGGEVIKLLQKQHNVNIQIDQTIDPCRVSVTGNQMYVGKAVEHIRDIINGGPLPGQGGAYGGMGGMPGVWVGLGVGGGEERVGTRTRDARSNTRVLFCVCEMFVRCVWIVRVHGVFPCVQSSVCWIVHNVNT